MRAWRAMIAMAAAFAAVSSPARADRADRVYTLVGTWTCESELRSAGIDRFVRNDDGSIAYTIRFRNESHPFRRPIEGEFDGVLRFDDALGAWQWTSTTPANQTFIEAGSGAPWTSAEWVVEGMKKVTIYRAGAIVPVRYVREKIRMVHTFLSESLFIREFDVLRSGTWVRDSRSACRRMGDPAAAS